MEEKKKETSQKKEVTHMKKDEWEQCVCCKTTTNIPRNLEIELRSFYVEGAGQLCGACYSDIYGLQRKKT